MQTDETNRDTEVLIVGAGPAGLMMACQLAIQGIRFRIIDKKEFPTTNSGALIIQARSIEILHQMGIAYKFIHEGIIANNINIVHNGKQLLKIPVKTIGTGLSRFPFLLMVKQSKTEQLLTEFINGYGFSIERRSELLRITPDTTGVISQIKNPDKKTESIKSHYLIAADGGQSLIRKQLKIPFIGKSHQQSLFIIDCKTDGKLTEDEIYISFSDKTISGYFPMINGKWRIDGTIPKVLNAKKAVTFEDIEEHFSERTLMDTKLHSPEWFSVFHSHQHHASTFQKNSCFLIGDAAHIHSPVGAQGMNTGLQDAYNLAWKLAHVLKGKAKPRLLDTYTTERMPVAKRTIQTTGHLFNLLTNDNFISRIFRPYALPLIIKKLFPLFVNRKWIRQYIFKSVAEIGIHYRKSVLSHQPLISFPSSVSVRPGDRLPYITISENGMEVNIQDKVKGFHLFIFSRSVPSEEIINRIEKLLYFMSFEVILHSEINKKLYKQLGIKNEGFFLIRPDLYIAFKSNNLNIKQLEKYLDMYFTS